MRRLTVAAATAALLFAFIAPAGASHSWQSYHWERSSNPFELSFGNNLSSSWQTYFGNAVTEWSRSSVVDATATAGGSNSNCDPNTGVVEVCNGAYGQNGWLGLTQIWINGSHITQGIVKLNDTYFAMSSYNNPVARQNVMCHELGHAHGLDHRKGPKAKSCLNDSFGLNDPAFQNPDAHDYEQLEAIYCHLDGVSTCGGGGGGGKGKKNNRAHGHGPFFSRDGGQLVLTWVFPAGR